MKPPRFNYRRMGSVDELLDALGEHGDEAAILAGGQSLIPSLNMRLSAPAALLDINEVPDLAGVTPSAEGLRILPLTRHRYLERSATVSAALPLIALAMPHVAHVAVRNRGTIGGSLALGDPAAELPALMTVYDASLVLRSAGGDRHLPIRAFYKGLYDSVLEPEEFLAAIEIPRPDPGERIAFGEFSRRHGDYALAGVALRVSMDGLHATDATLVLFGVADRPILVAGAREAVHGRRLDRSLGADLAALAVEGWEALHDAQTSAATRRHLAGVLVRRAVAAANRGDGNALLPEAA